MPVSIAHASGFLRAQHQNWRVVPVLPQQRQFVAVVVIQRFIDDTRWSIYGKYAFMTLSTVTLAGMLTLDQGPKSAPVHVLLLLQAASLLVVPTPRMVGISTIAASISYSALLARAHFIRPENQMSFEQAAALYVNIVAMGLVLFLILRCSKVQSRGTDSPSNLFFGKRDL